MTGGGHSATIVFMNKEQVPVDPYVIDSLMPDLVGHDRRPSAYVLYLAMVRRARPDGTISLSLQSLAVATGLSKTATQRSIAHLVRRGLLAVQFAETTQVPVYRLLQPWVRS
jgi:hypothetical protein